MTGSTGMRGCEVEPAELEGGTLGPFSMRGRPIGMQRVSEEET